MRVVVAAETARLILETEQMGRRVKSVGKECVCARVFEKEKRGLEICSKNCNLTEEAV